MHYIMYMVVVKDARSSWSTSLSGRASSLGGNRAMDTLVCDSIPLCPSVRRSAANLGPLDVMHRTASGYPKRPAGSTALG